MPLNLDWYNSNALRNYPLVDEATRLDVTGTFEVPNDFLVDLNFPVPSSAVLALDPAGFYISEIASFGPGLILTLSHSNNGSLSRVGTISVAAASHTQDKTYFVYGDASGAFAGSVGRVTIRSLAGLAGGGVYQFTLAATRLVPCCFRPEIRSIGGIQVANGTDLSEVFYGLITLNAGTNVALRLDGPNVIRIDAQSTGLDQSCECSNDVTTAPPIRTINGVAPVNNNITLSGTACVSFDSTGVGTINVSDLCSQPCCGSPELTIVQNASQQLNLDVYTLRSAMDQLETQLLAMQGLKAALEASGLLSS